MSQKKSVYLMQCENYYKIGISSDPIERLNDMQTANPYKIKLIAETKLIEKANEIETMLHQRFNEKRKRGEWFELNIKDVDFIKHEVFDEQLIDGYICVASASSNAKSGYE